MECLQGLGVYVFRLRVVRSALYWLALGIVGFAVG